MEEKDEEKVWRSIQKKSANIKIQKPVLMYGNQPILAEKRVSVVDGLQDIVEMILSQAVTNDIVLKDCCCAICVFGSYPFLNMISYAKTS